MRATLRFGCLLAALAVASGCEERIETSDAHSKQAASPVTTGSVSREELIGDLRDRDFDASIAAFNRVKGMTYQGEILPTVVQLWNGKIETMGGVTEEFVTKPRIRIELADILIQSASRGKSTVPIDEIARFARTAATSSDEDVAGEAILVLGERGDARDLPIIREAILSEKEGVFGKAVLALALHCSADGKLVEELVRQVKLPRDREAIRTTWDTAKDHRGVMCLPS